MYPSNPKIVFFLRHSPYEFPTYCLIPHTQVFDTCAPVSPWLADIIPRYPSLSFMPFLFPPQESPTNSDYLGYNPLGDNKDRGPKVENTKNNGVNEFESTCICEGSGCPDLYLACYLFNQLGCFLYVYFFCLCFIILIHFCYILTQFV